MLNLKPRAKSIEKLEHHVGDTGEISVTYKIQEPDPALTIILYSLECFNVVDFLPQDVGEEDTTLIVRTTSTGVIQSMALLMYTTTQDTGEQLECQK